MSKLLSLIIQSRLDSSDVYAYHSYGSLPNYIAQKINQITGVNCRSSEILITAYDIAHIFKGHGNDILERERGQIGITAEDFELIKTIIYEFESVQKGKILRNTN